MPGLLDKRRVRAAHRMADLRSGRGDVAVTKGWRSVQAVAVVDSVLTFDKALPAVVAITRTPIASLRDPLDPRPGDMAHFPADAIAKDARKEEGGRVPAT